MGNKYALYAWACTNNGFEYIEVWRGEWFIVGMFYLFLKKVSGKYGCIKLECR